MTILLLPEELEMGLLRPKYTKLDLVLLQNVYAMVDSGKDFF